MRAAQHDPVQHARQDDVVGVAAHPLEQPRVLDPTNRLREAEFRRRHDRVSALVGAACPVTGPSGQGG